MGRIKQTSLENYNSKVIGPKSMNIIVRRKEMEKIELENNQMAVRILSQKPNLNIQGFEDDFRYNLYLKKQLNKFR